VTEDGPGIGVIGLGFMGATHINAWRQAALDGHPNRLVAVCDRNPARRAGQSAVGPAGQEPLQFDRGAVALYADAAELFADPAVDVVSITTPTESHVPLALAALAAAKHVLVEKPVALEVAAVQRLQQAAASAGTLCMPAQCIRFWPGWDWLIARVDDRSLGALKALHVQRLSSRPDWGDGFYDDATRCGGVVHDLHVHDADWIRRLAGDPQWVSAREQSGQLTIEYGFIEGGGPEVVVAEASWARDPTEGFFMGYEAEFERGGASWSSQREPPLQLAGPGPHELPAWVGGTGYDGQLRHLLAVLSGEVAALEVTMADAVASARMLEAVDRSLASGGAVPL